MSAGQLTLPVTVPQRAQMTQIGAHHARHRLTCRTPARRKARQLARYLGAERPD